MTPTDPTPLRRAEAVMRDGPSRPDHPLPADVPFSVPTDPTPLLEPTFDRDGYPTEETLERIRSWDIQSLADYEAAMDFAGAAWSYPDRWQKERDWKDPDWPNGGARVRYVFSTGGWSGNESIAAAIEANQMLQVIGAWSWRRGGHYEYRFPQEPSRD